MLKSVRYGGLRVFILNVHWLHALATATIIVSFGPNMMRARKSTAYETDIVEPLLESGRLTLNAELMTDSVKRIAKRRGWSNLARGVDEHEQYGAGRDDRRDVETCHEWQRAQRLSPGGRHDSSYSKRGVSAHCPMHVPQPKGQARDWSESRTIHYVSVLYKTVDYTSATTVQR